MTAKNEKKKYICTDEHLRPLADKFAAFVAAKRLFLTPGITLDRVAGLMHENRAYLTLAINRFLKRSFPDYMNQMRIAELTRLLQSNPSMTITVAAVQAGFTDRQNCSRVCRKITGLSPTDLRKCKDKKQTLNEL